MAGEVALGLGYVELTVKDRNAAASLSNLQRELRSSATEVERFSSRTRTSLVAATNAFQSVSTAMASGASPLHAFGRGIVGVTASLGAVAGPLGAVAALLATMVGLKLADWLRESAAEAERLAAAIGKVDKAKGELPGALGSVAAAGSPAEEARSLARPVASERARAIAAGDAQRAGGSAGDPVILGRIANETGTAALQRLQELLASGAAGANRASALGAGSSPSALKQAAKDVQDYADTLHAIASDPAAFKLLETLTGNIGLGGPNRRLATNLASELREAVALAKQLTAEAEAIEAVERSIGAMAKDLADAFESAAKSAAGSREELEAAERNAATTRERAQNDRVAADARRGDLAARRDVLALRAAGYDAEADALERRQRFDELRRTATPEERALLDEQERLEATIAAGRSSGLAVRGGGTTDLLGGLRAFQAGVFGGGGDSPDERTAKAARETADAAKRAEETDKRMVELLKQIAESTRNGGPATLG